MRRQPLVVLQLLVCLWCLTACSSKPEPEPVYDVAAREFISEWKANPSAWREKYVGKVVRLRCWNVSEGFGIKRITSSRLRSWAHTEQIDCKWLETETNPPTRDGETVELRGTVEGFRDGMFQINYASRVKSSRQSDETDPEMAIELKDIGVALNTRDETILGKYYDRRVELTGFYAGKTPLMWGGEILVLCEDAVARSGEWSMGDDAEATPKLVKHGSAHIRCLNLPSAEQAALFRQAPFDSKVTVIGWFAGSPTDQFSGLTPLLVGCRFKSPPEVAEQSEETEPRKPRPADVATDAVMSATELLKRLQYQPATTRKELDGKVVELYGRLVASSGGRDAHSPDDDYYQIGGWQSDSTINCYEEYQARGGLGGSIKLITIGGFCRIKGRLAFKGDAPPVLEECVLRQSDATVEGLKATYSVTAEQLARGFGSSESSSAYIDQVIELKGTVSEHLRTITGLSAARFVHIDGQALCVFYKDTKWVEENLPVGREVTIIGYCTGREGRVMAERLGIHVRGCILAK
ncbi:MAG: hypothetical protein IT464_06025 [Planctomycetes bacterium]|nr:hypothetical protein [Planctomycetota bacterium]